MTAKFEALLIATVENHSVLWNINHVQYKYRDARQMAWSQVASIVGCGCDAKMCQSRFKSLRDKYVRRKAFSKNLPSGSGGGKKQQAWDLDDAMAFLDASIAPRKTSSNLSIETSPSLDEASNSYDEHESGGVQFMDEDDYLFEENVVAENSTSTTPSRPSSGASWSNGSSSNTPPPASPMGKSPSGSGNNFRGVGVNNRKRDSSVLDLALKALSTKPPLPPVAPQEQHKPHSQCDNELCGGVVANTLKRLAPKKAAKLRMQISSMLYEAEFGDDV